MDDVLTSVNKRKVVVDVENIAEKILKTCEVCCQEFSLVDYLSHRKVHSESSRIRAELETKQNGVVNGISTPELFNCSLCGDVFTKEATFRIHQIQEHSLTLVSCLKRAAIPTTVQNNAFKKRKPSESVTKKRFKCRYCDKLFLLPSQCKSHENTHVLEPVPAPSLNSNSIPPDDTVALKSEVVDSSSGSAAIPSDLSESSVPIPNKTVTMEMAPIYGDTLPRTPTTMEMPKLIASTPRQCFIEYSSAGDSMKSDQGTTVSSYQTNYLVSNQQPTYVNQDVVPSVVSVPMNDFVSTPTPTLPNGNIVPTKSEPLYKCLVCAESFLECNLFAHVKSHLKKGQKECGHCEYKSMTSADLRDHLLPKHYNLKPYKCPLCSSSYAWNSGYKKHLTTHVPGSDRKVFSCGHDQCTMTFTTERECRRHRLTHALAATTSALPVTTKAKTRKSGKKSKTPKVNNVRDHPDPVETPGTNTIPTQNFQCSQPSQQLTVPQYSSTHQAGSRYHQYNLPAQNSYANTPPYGNTYNHHQQQHQSVQSYYTGGNYNNVNSTTNYSHSQPQFQSQSSWVETQQQQTYTNAAYTNELQHSVQQQNHNWNNAEQHYPDQNLFNNHQSFVQTPPPQTTPQTVGQFRTTEDPRKSETCKTCHQDIPIDQLLEHIQSHLVPGQRVCTICQCKSSSKTYLVEHYNIHYGLKPFPCDICDRRFAMRSYLRSHMQHVHDNEGSARLKCRYCSKRFVRPNQCRAHEMIHETHGDTVPMDSDSNSNSNASFRTPLTPERRSTTATSSPTASHVGYSRSNTNSPPTTAPSTPGKEAQWVDSQVHPTAWPQYETVTVTSGGGYDQGWNSYSPLVKSDVHWTQRVYDSPCQQQMSHHNPSLSTPQKLDSNWSNDSSSTSGFYSNSNSTIPSSSVQDLWAELHFEEMKWFPEASPSLTADGIPMITELAPLDGSSYTEMLYNATADLPLFTNNGPPTAAFVPAQNPETKPNLSAVVAGSLESGEPLVSSRKPRRRTNRKPEPVAKRISESDDDYRQASPTGSSLGMESGSDGGNAGMTEEEMSTLTKCLVCHKEIGRHRLLDHVRSHLKPGQRTCDICKKTYCNYLTLKGHVHVHYDLKPYKCCLCPESFSTPYQRKSHEVLSHEQNKVKILPCPYPGCGKVYFIRSELHKHMKTHSKKNGVTIPIPLKELKKKSIKRRISQESFCSLKDDTEFDVKQISEAKSRIWEVLLEDVGKTFTKECPFCKEKIVLTDFSEHKRNHRDPCHICGKPTLVSEILSHGPTHVGLEEKDCTLCPYELGSVPNVEIWEHLNLHLNVDPIRCDLCGDGFPTRVTFDSHYITRHMGST